MTAGGTEEVKEKQFEGVTRGLFSYFLQRALSSSEEGGNESLFCDEFQHLLKNKSKDTNRKNTKVVNPQEVVEWVRIEMIKNGHEHIPQCGSLNEPNSKFIGIPFVGNTKEDFKILISRNQLKTAKEIAEKVKKEIEKQSKPISTGEMNIEMKKYLCEFYGEFKLSVLDELDEKRKNRELSETFVNLEIKQKEEREDQKISLISGNTRELFENENKSGIKIEIEKKWSKIEKYQSNLKESNQFEINRRILIEGKAGIGKSTFCKRICQQFSKNEIWKDQNFIEFVFHVDLKEIIGCGISDLVEFIFEKYF
jgi:hypothetical protein